MIQLHNGDCLDILRSLPDASVDAVVTDPPYGIDCTKTGCGETGRKGFVNPGRFTLAGAARIAGDRKPDARWLAEAFRLTRVGGVLYSFSRWDVDREWHTAIEAAGFKPKNRIAWVKANHGSGDLTGAFGFQYESLWRAAKGRPRLRVKRGGDVWRDAWTECVRHGKSHPFEKPADLIERAVLADTDEGMTVLDPFMGSGTTGVACVNTGRNFIGIELSPEYYAIAERRIREAEAAKAESMFATLP